MCHPAANDKLGKLIVSVATHRCRRDESCDGMRALSAGFLFLDNPLGILST